MQEKTGCDAMQLEILRNNEIISDFYRTGPCEGRNRSGKLACLFGDKTVVRPCRLGRDLVNKEENFVV